ncbi:iron-sulfur cluster co-chaperone protein HscB-like [Tubulanus polymorphus]|uniref:iron-sulfur cluster co-chaperone protein HscB-like n=1 Tax=Tubulanus polymorphus TaxID=672921 RepID=UPI003DA639AC
MAAPMKYIQFCKKSCLNVCFSTLRVSRSFTSVAVNSTFLEDCGKSKSNCQNLSKRQNHPLQCRFLCPYVTMSERQCWKCGRHNGAAKKETFFCKCGVIQEVPDDITYFDVMRLERSFVLDTQELISKKRHLQKELHPDRYGQKTDIEQNLSIQQSTLVNEAFKTLSEPLSRGLYLLGLHGESIEEGSTEMKPDFLMEIMEINEDISAIETDAEAVALNKNNKSAMENLIGKITKAFNAEDILLAKELLARLQYYENISVKLGEVMMNRGIVVK